MDRTFAPARNLRASLRVPADKSVAHRALILAAMVSGTSRIEGQVPGADVASTISCIQALGCRVQAGGKALVVHGTGWHPPDRADLYAGNSGTTMRLLSGALAGRRGTFTLSGDASLSRRPMLRVATPLRRMGAGVRLAEGDRPPVTIVGGDLSGISYSSEVASAQVKGAVLLAGLQAEGTTTVTEVLPTRDHTERLLRWLGGRVEQAGSKVSVLGGDEIFRRKGFELVLPGDLSSAAFLLVAACLCPRSALSVEGVGLNPGRTGVLEVLEAMEADIAVVPAASEPEPVGVVTARTSTLKAVDIGGPVVPRAVDELPILALAATQAHGTTVIRDAADLRVKESDRIAVLARGLRKLGARVQDLDDGLIIQGPTPLQGGTVDSGGDHRMALTFAVAGLIARAPVRVLGWEAAGVSYPGFARDLDRAVG